MSRTRPGADTAARKYTLFNVRQLTYVEKGATLTSVIGMARERGYGKIDN